MQIENQINKLASEKSPMEFAQSVKNGSSETEMKYFIFFSFDTIAKHNEKFDDSFIIFRILNFTANWIKMSTIAMKMKSNASINWPIYEIIFFHRKSAHQMSDGVAVRTTNF